MVKRIDFETLSKGNQNILQFDLIAFNDERENFDTNLIDTHSAFKTRAQIEVKVTNIDDSPPKIKIHGSDQIEIPENSPFGMILTEFSAVDLDSKNLKFQLQGFEIENFYLKKVCF